MKNLLSLLLLAVPFIVNAQDLKLNDREYFERQGVNVLVFSNNFNGGFNDEKNSGIEIIHHGVRTVQGGAVRLSNTPEQWDLVPKTISRKVDRDKNSIEVSMRYDDYDFDSRVVVTAKGKAVEISVWLDKPVPEKLAGEAGLNIEFLPSQYWLKTYSVDGRLGRLPRYATSHKRSGTPDDMWAFTTRNPRLDLQAAGVFTSAARVLKGYNDDLAKRAQTQADRLRKEATELLAKRNVRRNAQAETDDAWLYGDANLVRNVQTALDSVPMKDKSYLKRIRPLIVKFAEYVKSFDAQNPYGVPIGLGNWAGVNMVLNFGIAVNYAHIYFPDIVSKDEIYRVSNWLYGCHPYHNYSFVAVVGAARPKQVFYGNNRADFSFIPGNVAPGLLFRQPDHFENYDDWPFLWGQNEGTIAGNTQYVIFGSSFKNIVTK